MRVALFNNTCTKSRKKIFSASRIVLPRGLTLMEIIIATLIFALVMAGLANLFIAAKRLTLHARSRIQASELGKQFLDPLQMQVRQDQWGANCVSNNANCLAELPVPLGGIDFNATYTSGTVAGTNLRIVNVTLNWNEPD